MDEAIAHYQELAHLDAGGLGPRQAAGRPARARRRSARAPPRQFARWADHLFTEGFHSKAAALYKKVLKLETLDEHALWQLGEVSMALKLRADARVAFQRVRRPAAAPRRCRRRRAGPRSARTHSRLGRRSRSRRHAATLCRAGPSHPRRWSAPCRWCLPGAAPRPHWARPSALAVEPRTSSSGRRSGADSSLALEVLDQGPRDPDRVPAVA